MEVKKGWLNLCLLAVLIGPATTLAGDPIRVGYAIVTPNPVNVAPVASCIFGQTINNTTSEAGQLATGLTTNSSLFVAVDGPTGKNVGVAIANPNSMAATIAFSLADNTGTVVVIPQRIMLNGYNQITRFVTDLFSDRTARGFIGTLLITSDVPLAITGLRFHGDSMTTMPMADLSQINYPVPVRDGVTGGPGSIVFPVVGFGASFQTGFIMVSTATSSIRGRIDFFAQDGSPMTVRFNDQTGSSFPYMIPSHGVLVLE